MTIALVIFAISLVCLVGMIAPESNALAALTVVFLVFTLIQANDERLANKYRLKQAVATNSTPVAATDSTTAATPAATTDSTPDTNSTVELARKVERQTEQLLYRVMEMRVRQICPEAGPIFEDLYLDPPDAGVESSPASESSATESSASNSAKDDECGWCSENFLEDDSIR